MIIKSSIIIFIGLLLYANNLQAKDVKFTKSSNVKLLKPLQVKANIINETAGFKFIENNLNDNPLVDSFVIKEIYSKPVSNQWNGGIFHITVTTVDGTHSQIVKLFYNEELVVKDIYSIDGESMILLLKLPLVSKEIAYNKKYLIYSKKDGIVSENGNNMVIISDPQCPFCKDNVPELLDLAKEKNMNVYYYDFPLAIKSHINSEKIAECLATAISKNKNNSIDIIKNIYSHDFDSSEKSMKQILKEFNTVSGVAKITLDDIANSNAHNHIKDGKGIVESLYIESTPTVYVDGKIYKW